MIDEVDDLLTLHRPAPDLGEEPLTQPPLTSPFRDRRRHGRQPRAARAPGRDRQLVRAPPGPPPRRRPRGLGDGLELRAPPPQRAHDSRAACASTPAEHPVSIQLFGHDPGRDALGRGDRRRCRRRPDRHQHGLPGAQGTRGGRRRGAACSRPSSPCGSPEAASEGSGRPVTVKLRSGLAPGDRSGLDLAVRLVEEAGVAAVALHPRSAAVQHKGKRRLRARPPSWSGGWRGRAVPVIVSGGLEHGRRGAPRLRESGADAVMIARGALGNPWIFEELTGRRGRREPPTRARDRRRAAVDDGARRGAPGRAARRALRAQVLPVVPGAARRPRPRRRRLPAHREPRPRRGSCSPRSGGRWPSQPDRRRLGSPSSAPPGAAIASL